MHKILIFLGPPGSGKGTQAKKIASKYGYGHISTGDLFRALASDPGANPADLQALEDMKSGKLVSDSLVYKLAFAAIEKELTAGRGVVLDGAVRNLAQAQEFQKFFEEKKLTEEVMVVEIALSDEESYDRLANRRVCSACGEIIPWNNATKNLTACPKCGGELKTRADDDPEVIKKRIVEQGNSALAPILDYYEKLGILKRVDGQLSIDEVEKAIEQYVN